MRVSCRGIGDDFSHIGARHLRGAKPHGWIMIELSGCIVCLKNDTICVAQLGQKPMQAVHSCCRSSCPGKHEPGEVTITECEAERWKLRPLEGCEILPPQCPIAGDAHLGSIPSCMQMVPEPLILELPLHLYSIQGDQHTGPSSAANKNTAAPIERANDDLVSES